MLESTAVSVDDLPLEVVLPPDLRNFMGEAGFMPPNPFEHRGAARLRVRCEALLECVQPPAFAAHLSRHMRVLSKDLSKTGLSFLAPRQMWPSETVEVSLLGRQIHATVVRCRKLGPLCFEVGARIQKVTGSLA